MERTDILAVQTDSSGRQIQVQVKASTARDWPLGYRGPRALAVSDAEWFVLVHVDKTVDGPVRCFIVPRDHLWAGVWIEHMAWLTDPDAKPGTRNAGVDKAFSQVVTFLGYEERWDLLDRPTTEAPVLLPASFREHATNPRIGLPPEHPWGDRVPG